MEHRLTRSRIGRIGLIAVFYLPFVAIVAAVGAVGLLTEVRVGVLTRDAAAVGDVPPYAGATSQLGLQLWGATAAVCLFTALLLHQAREARPAVAFLFQSGILTGVLLVDDALMVHEHTGRLFGIDETWMFAAYALAAVAIFWRHRSFIRQGEIALLGLCVLFLAFSMLLDMLHNFRLLFALGVSSSDVGLLLEDGFKLLGIAGWFIYFTRTAYGLLAPLLRPPPTAVTSPQMTHGM